ncbi:MAG: glutamate-1-semialdehyde 2,1-aminomutase [Gemmatimonadetes bacterium]|nr:glutamate-1-semialdehyde 2,1-aminomutase [Gemmatimonadota bacterium]NNF12211.1 glutamate-1-semialdehyde 2,1-aminomutase [Gemmatimonadota bacterium]
MTSRSQELFARANRLIPGGVNSPVRAFGSVGGDPPFIHSGSGSRIVDVDGNEYLDFIGSWGPMILGHAHAEVLDALGEVMGRGTSFGAPTEGEVRLAELIVDAVPSVEMVRLVNSGTEATMSALRLARAATGRDRVVKFRGGYHGHADAFLVQAGSGAATLGQPSSPGVPAGTAADTLVAEFNDTDGIRELFAEMGDAIAAVIVEPVSGNMGCIAPLPGYLETLRSVCDEFGALLIFDEVMTGFRVAHGGAQAVYRVHPDLTTLGKVIGGGLPVGAYGGRRDVMEMVAPSGPMYQAGTLSGNPLAVSAGIATLAHLAEHPEVYDRLDELGRHLDRRMGALVERHPDRLTWTRVGAMGGLAFAPAPVHGWAQVAESDQELFGGFFRDLLAEGIMLPPSCFEALFWSAAHTEGDMDRFADAAERSLSKRVSS